MGLVFRVHPRDIFVDASAFVALAVEDDDSHDEAVSVLYRLEVEGWRLFTINLMVAEAHSLVLRALGTDRAALFVERMYSRGSMVIEPVYRDDERAALQILRTYGDKTFSFADASAFAVMRRLNIAHAFSFDVHFKQYGHLHVLDSADSG